MLMAGKNPSRDGGMTYYADSVSEVPQKPGFDEGFSVGDVIICRSGGEYGVVAYMLFPSGWWKVG